MRNQGQCTEKGVVGPPVLTECPIGFPSVSVSARARAGGGGTDKEQLRVALSELKEDEDASFIVTAQKINPGSGTVKEGRGLYLGSQSVGQPRGSPGLPGGVPLP